MISINNLFLLKTLKWKTIKLEKKTCLLQILMIFFVAIQSLKIKSFYELYINY
jgi:hypothetical protein